MNSAPSARARAGQCRGERGSQPRERIAIEHPAHLAGDHVEVADHEAHDLHQQVGHPQPLQAAEHVVGLGGGGQGQRGEDAERALHQQAGRGHEPGFADTRQAEDLDARARSR